MQISLKSNRSASNAHMRKVKFIKNIQEITVNAVDKMLNHPNNCLQLTVPLSINAMKG